MSDLCDVEVRLDPSPQPAPARGGSVDLSLPLREGLGGGDRAIADEPALLPAPRRRFIPPAVASFDTTAPTLDSTASDDAFRHGFELGREEGLEAGRRESHAAVAAAHGAALARLQQDLDAARRNAALAQAAERLLAQRETDLARLEAECRRTIATAFRTLFPLLLAQDAGAAIAAIATEALALMPAARLILRAHPDTLTATALAALAAPLAARLDIRPDPELGPGAAELAWDDGGLVFDPAALLAQALAVIEPPSTEDTRS
jgi:hypothetical protein